VEVDDVNVINDSIVVADNELTYTEDNSTTVGDVDVDYTNVEDNVVVADNELDVEYNDIDDSVVVAKNDVDID